MAKRRQRAGNGNGSKFTIGGAKEHALHPMQKIANAAGSFEPLTIADKLKGSEALCAELSLRQERSELLAKQRHAVLYDINQMIKDHQLSRGKNPITSLSMESVDEGAQAARIALIARKSNLASLNSLMNNVGVAVQRLEDLADSLEQHDKETSLLPSFLFATDDSSCSDAKQIIMHIRALREACCNNVDAHVSPNPKTITNTRVKAKSERERTYNDRTYAKGSKSSSESEVERLNEYIKQSKSNAGQRHKGKLINFAVQAKGAKA